MKPDAFAAVMATGIVSIAMAQQGYQVVSTALAVLAAVALPVLAVTGALRWRREPLDIADPDVTVRLFTFVAACAVLDTRLAEIPGVLWTLAVLALAVWSALVVFMARAVAAQRWSQWREQARGAWELPSVGTSGLAIVLTGLAQFTGWRPLVGVAVALWGLALLTYVVMTSLIVRRALLARLDPNGFEPDAWILMGALAIAALAGHHVHRLLDPGWVAEVARWGAGLAWAGATLWLAPLLYFALRYLYRPQVLRFAGVWWAMVFPLGMYAVATNVTVEETGWVPLTAVSSAVCWIATLTWLAVAVGGLAHATTFLRHRRAERRTPGIR